MVRAVDDALADHDAWDSIPVFQLLGANAEGRMVPRLVAGIDPRVHPSRYPAVFGQLTGGYLGKVATVAVSQTPVLACLFRFEAYGLIAPSEADLLPEELAAIKKREIHTMPHRVEEAIVYAVDPGGRMWHALKRRGTAGDPDEVISASARVSGHTGNIPAALQACAGLIPPAYVAAAQSFWKSRVKGRG